MNTVSAIHPKTISQEDSITEELFNKGDFYESYS